MQYESERIEYKSQMIDDIYKEVIAFANTDGGVIYLGIDDQGKVRNTKLGDTEFYAQELFASEELAGYLNQNMFESQRSVYDYVVYDSNIERGFAEQLENNENIKVYAKLPSWFKIPTPLGNYNPDWAVVVENDGLDKLYFVIETKGSTDSKDIRPTEDAKIVCGMKHFEELGNQAKFVRTDSFQKLAEQIV